MRAITLLFLCSSAMASNSSINLQIPNGVSSYASDKFRSGDLDCSHAVAGSTNLEFGVTGILNNADAPQEKDVGIYARVVIPLDGPKQRINCNVLYELELEKKRIELSKLRQELENLKNLKRGFEN